MNVFGLLILLLLLGSGNVIAGEAGKFLFVFGNVTVELADGTKGKATKGMSLPFIILGDFNMDPSTLAGTEDEE